MLDPEIAGDKRIFIIAIRKGNVLHRLPLAFYTLDAAREYMKYSKDEAWDIEDIPLYHKSHFYHCEWILP